MFHMKHRCSQKGGHCAGAALAYPVTLVPRTAYHLETSRVKGAFAQVSGKPRRGVGLPRRCQQRMPVLGRGKPTPLLSQNVRYGDDADGEAYIIIAIAEAGTRNADDACFLEEREGIFAGT